MTFDLADYRRGAGNLRRQTPVVNLMAVSAVESAGQNFWMINGKQVPPIRLEAHWFSAKTGHQYDRSNPDISSTFWNPALAAKTWAGAWAQYDKAKAINATAAAEATSWGPFQIMGFHWKALGYADVQHFVDDVDGPDDDGQMDMFVKFVNDDPHLLNAIASSDWQSWETYYNGGGYNGAYAAKVEDWLAAHGNSPQPVVPRILRIGRSGPDVVRLQTALNMTADGEFGPLTDASVHAYQAAHGLVSDGIVGVMTLRSLGLAN